MTDLQVVDKSLRSVFVGNIPYEATEEQLKEIFSQVGQVLSFKLVYDRETGKPKGYGFCEYRDQETALSAMRNLNGFEIGGRTLRVDNACTEKSRLELQNVSQGPTGTPQFGDEVEPEKAPEAISKAVASLPPEQMFELMRQMKICIQNNPAEARTMLMQNPQLAYALLQAQVVMRIVDPEVAVTMLHKSQKPPPVLEPPVSKPFSRPQVDLGAPGGPLQPPGPEFGLSGPGQQRPFRPQRDDDFGPSRGMMGDPMGPPGSRGPPGPAPFRSGPPSSSLGNHPPMGFNDMQDMDLRQRGRARPGPPGSGDMDMRGPPRGGDMDLRQMPGGPGPGPRATMMGDVTASGPRDPRLGGPPSRPPGMDFDRFSGDKIPPHDRFAGSAGNDRDMRDGRYDPRLERGGGVMEGNRPPVSAGGGIPGLGPMPKFSLPSGAAPAAGQSPDQEKAALIMQVLQLSDEQIALLPQEQRHSIMVLKSQIAKSANP